MMPKNAHNLFWAAVGSAELSAFFVGMFWSDGNRGGFLVSLAFLAVATFAVIVNQMADT